MKTILVTMVILFVMGIAIGVAGIGLEKFKETELYKRNESNFQKLLVAIVVIAIGWWFLVGSARGGVWEGEGYISVFPDGDSTKNYRLPASISVEIISKSLFGNQQKYIVDDASWPNGGTLDLDGCVATEEAPTTLCSDQEGTAYIIEVTEPPEDNREYYSDDY